MAAPNLINATTINGKLVGANLTTTSSTMVLNNASGSGKCLKINTLNVSNFGNATAVIAITANLAGTVYTIAGNISVPSNSILNIMDKTSQYYLEENHSISAAAGTANVLVVTCSYEDIS